MFTVFGWSNAFNFYCWSTQIANHRFVLVLQFSFKPTSINNPNQAINPEASPNPKLNLDLAKVLGVRPSGRNGHSATLLGESILILGGWLGNGPLAAGEAWRRILNDASTQPMFGIKNQETRIDSVLSKIESCLNSQKLIYYTYIYIYI